MTWQDWALTGAAWAMNLALLPALRATTTPPFLTGILTASCLTTIGVTYISLGLISAAVTVLVGAAMWALLSYRAY